MSNKQAQRPANDFNPDTIDLLDLIESVWQEKILIVLITAIITAMALAYLLTTKPSYQASALLSPPSANAIQSYQLGRQEAGLSEYSTVTVYDTFLSTLNAQQLRQQFFEEVYLASLSAEQQASASDLFAGFNQALSIQQAKPRVNKDLYQVSFTLANAEKAAELANAYVQEAIALSKQTIKNDIEAEIRSRKASIALNVDLLLSKAKVERHDEIIRLQEALSIAKAIGLENPLVVAGKSTEEGAHYIDRNLAYMRGAKALSSQIHALETRKDDHAFVPGLRDITAQLNLLNTFSLDNSQTEVASLESPARAPSKPIKPNKPVIMLVAVLLGGMLGVFTALIRIAIRQRKQRLA